MCCDKQNRSPNFLCYDSAVWLESLESMKALPCDPEAKPVAFDFVSSNGPFL